MLKKIILPLCLVVTPHIAQSSETCESMRPVAMNFSNSAYQLTLDDQDAIGEMGFFDAWMMYLTILFEGSEKEKKQSDDFYLAAKVAGSYIQQEKDQLIKKLAPKDFEKLFPRMVVRSCEIIKSGKK